MANRNSKAYKRRQYSAADESAIQLHLAALVSMGCIPCFIVGQKSMTGVHHIRQGLGMGQRSSDLRTLGLCHEHHQSATRDHVSIHAKPKLFRFLFGTELALLTRTLDQLYPDRVYPQEYTEKVIDELNSYRESP